jgi:hypothetical protein
MSKEIVVKSIEEPVTLPAEIVEALVMIALRTETGSALLAGFRSGHPDLSTKSGRIGISISHPATVTIEPAAP